MASFFLPKRLAVGIEAKVGDESEASFESRVTDLNDGNFLLSWLSDDNLGVNIQIIHANGHKVGNEIRIAPATGFGAAGFYDIKQAPDGDIWLAVSHAVPGTFDYSVFTTSVSESQLEEGLAEELSPEWYSVDRTPIGNQLAPSIDFLPDGRAAVSWVDAGTTSGQVKLNILQSPAISSTGDLLVNNLNLSDGLVFSGLTVLESGNFVVVWDSVNFLGSSPTIQFQMFNGSGIKIGTPVTVPASNEAAPFDGSVAALSDGGFVVVWQSATSFADLSDIRFQVFNSNGTERSEEIVAHINRAGDQVNPTVEAREDGGFFIAWTDKSGTSLDPGIGTFGREFYNSGIPAGAPFLLNNDERIGDQEFPEIAISDGKVLASWSSYFDGGATLVDEDRLKVFDLASDDWNNAGLDAPEPREWVRSVDLEDGTTVSLRVVTIGRDRRDLLEHRAADGEVLFSSTLSTGTELTLSDVDSSLVHVRESQTSFTSRPFYVYDSVSQQFDTPGGQFYNIDLRADFTSGGPITGVPVIASTQHEGRTFVLVSVGTDSRFETDVYLQEVSSLNFPVGEALAVPLSANDVEDFRTLADGTIVIHTTTTGGYLYLSPPSATFERPPVVEDLEVDKGGELDLTDFFPDNISFSIAGNQEGAAVSLNGLLEIEETFAGDTLTVLAHNAFGLITPFFLSVEGLRVQIGTSGPDNIVGDNGADELRGNAGNDTLDGGRGNDFLSGREGNDILLAGVGDDRANGGDGDDTIRGGRGEDTLNGGDGNDSIVGQRNADIIYGVAGRDTLKGGGGNDTLDGGDADDFLKGGTRLDVLNGGAGNDRLIGNSFEDILNGGTGNDNLNAGGGDDTLTGGSGNDTMKGGAGSDLFIFANGNGDDIIQDFDAGNSAEKIDLRGVSGVASFGDLTGPNGAANQIGSDVLIDLGSNGSIQLENVRLSDLGADDFIF